MPGPSLNLSGSKSFLISKMKRMFRTKFKNICDRLGTAHPLNNQ